MRKIFKLSVLSLTILSLVACGKKNNWDKETVDSSEYGNIIAEETASDASFRDGDTVELMPEEKVELVAPAVDETVEDTEGDASGFTSNEEIEDEDEWDILNEYNVSHALQPGEYLIPAFRGFQFYITIPDNIKDAIWQENGRLVFKTQDNVQVTLYETFGEYNDLWETVKKMNDVKVPNNIGTKYIKEISFGEPEPIVYGFLGRTDVIHPSGHEERLSRTEFRGMVVIDGHYIRIESIAMASGNAAEDYMTPDRAVEAENLIIDTLASIRMP